MSFLSDNVIPGNYGKTFTTDAVHEKDLEKIQTAILRLDGIKDVIFEEDSNPVVFTIHTNKIVSVEDIEERVKWLDFHAIPTGPFFPLF